jgi:hypothetical protein
MTKLIIVFRGSLKALKFDLHRPHTKLTVDRPVGLQKAAENGADSIQKASSCNVSKQLLLNRDLNQPNS